MLFLFLTTDVFYIFMGLYIIYVLYIYIIYLYTKNIKNQQHPGFSCALGQGSKNAQVFLTILIRQNKNLSEQQPGFYFCFRIMALNKPAAAAAAARWIEALCALANSVSANPL